MGDKSGGEKPQSGAGVDGTHRELPPGTAVPLLPPDLRPQILSANNRETWSRVTTQPRGGGIRRGKGREQRPCIRPSPWPGRGRIPSAPVTGTNTCCGTGGTDRHSFGDGGDGGGKQRARITAPGCQGRKHDPAGGSERRSCTQPTPLCRGDAGPPVPPSPRRAVPPQGCCRASDLPRAVTQQLASCAFGTPENVASPFHFPCASPAAGAGGRAQPRCLPRGSPALQAPPPQGSVAPTRHPKSGWHQPPPELGGSPARAQQHRRCLLGTGTQPCAQTPASKG